MKRCLIKTWSVAAGVLLILLLLQPMIFMIKLPQLLQVIMMVISGVLASWLLLSLINGINQGWQRFLKRVPLMEQLFKNQRLNALISNYLGLIVATLYCLYTFSIGVMYRSAWFITQAFYYLLLFLIRLILSHQIRTSRRSSPAARLKTCLMIGWLLLLFTPILGGMTILILHQESSTTHFSQNVLLVVALYTFINLGSVLHGFAKTRRATILLKTDKNVVMVTALISLYNLQTLMLAAYSHDQQYSRLMTWATGLGIVVLIIALAVWMIIESRHKIKQLANNAG